MPESTQRASSLLVELIKRGHIGQPTRSPTRLKMPTAYRWEPSLTSAGTALASPEEVSDAQLERGPKGNRKG